MMTQTHKEAGMTVLELVVVTVIIGILALIGASKYLHTVDQSKEATTRANMHTLHTMIEIYASETGGKYPEDLSALAALANTKQFNKYLTNPFTNNKGFADNTSVALTLSDAEFSSLVAHQVLVPYRGRALYYAIGDTSYRIYGCGEEGSLIMDQSVPLVLSNS